MILVRRIHSARCLLTFALALVAFSPAARAADGFSTNALYRFEWNGLAFGEMAVVLNQSSARWSAEARIRAGGGLAGLFNPHESNSAAEPGWFETYYTTRGKPRHVEVTYAPGGSLAAHTIEPAEPAGKRPALDKAKLSNSFNPLQYLLQLRHEVKTRAKTGGEFSLMLFDGKRLTETAVSVKPHGKANRLGVRVPAVVATLTRTPAGGYTEKELKKADATPIAVYFSNDEAFIPLKIEVKLAFGTLSATLATLCDGQTPCAFSPSVGTKQAANIPLPKR